ncbi:protein SUPPRESSOR OF PHYA-105 1-like [Zingiber officinale]|uniref:protein SUPPRESSOR OF PHYA-105 1-like n=1 Tax=Zingiber officinale TaxID=94328 RepID=UPI001C4BBC2F|nr:protein SUPPRESSOR OF PHYA-105 1-like [Zingiber officinale]XP_042394309.1 protein SUPPRESSOR OF PHYA-105 1-like [Zingiber officinale]
MERSEEVNEIIEDSEPDAPHFKRVEIDKAPEEPNCDSALETQAHINLEDAEWSEHFALLHPPGLFGNSVTEKDLNVDMPTDSGRQPHCSGLNSLGRQEEMVEELTLKSYRNPNLSIGSSTGSGEKPSNKLGLWKNFTRLTGKSRDKDVSESFSVDHSDDFDNKVLPPSSGTKRMLVTQSEPKASGLSDHISKAHKHLSSNTEPTNSPVVLQTKVPSGFGFHQYLLKTSLKGKGVTFQGKYNAPGTVISQHVEQPSASMGITLASSHTPSAKADDILFDKVETSNPYKREIILREWLKPKDQKINKVERMHIFKQIVDFVDICHSRQIILQNLRPSYFVKLPSNQVKYIGSFAPQSEIEHQDSVGRYIHHLDSRLKRKKGSGQDNDTRQVSSVKLQKFHGLKCFSSEHPTCPSCSDFEGVDHLEHDADNFRSSNPSNDSMVLKLDRKNMHGNSSFNSQQSTLLKLEESWYASPEEINDHTCSFSTNVYSLGLLLFELLCCCKTWKLHSAEMLNLRHRILPPTFVSENLKEVGFILWLLHPDPSCRPRPRDILQSDLLNESKDLLSVDKSSALVEEEDAESDLLLYFLSSLKEEKVKQASKLEAELAWLKADIEEAEKRHLSRAQLYLDSTKFLLNRVDSSSMNENTVSHIQQLQSHSKSNKYEQRLMKNFDQLENAYFSQISKIDTAGPITAIHSDCGILKNSNRYSLIQNDANEAKDCLGTFFNGLCKYARYSKFEVCGSLKKVDTFNSVNVICALSFDRDEDYFAAAGVSKKIKIFEFGALLNDNLDVHYPLVEMSSRSKLSCVCWNTYINSYLASADYEGVVQLWDASTGHGFTRFTEHQKRAWSVNFSVVDPTKLASGSDDCTVKLWSINEKNSIDTIRTMANVCSVQFSCSSHLLAIGCADYKTYCYDLRNTRIPWCTLSGHGKAVSYVKFIDSETLVSASTDNTLKIWDLEKTNSGGFSTNACSLTLSGHTNEKNFIGLSVCDGYIACGSETNEVYAYYRAFPMPMTSHKFGSIDPITGQETNDDGGQFVSSVCWRSKSNMVIAANSTGRIKVLKLV